MRTLPGVNIQFPISELLLNGTKKIETREYALPAHLKNIDLAFIETPGRTGKFKARIVGTIRFSNSFLYRSKGEFEADQPRHLVGLDSPYAWDQRPKYGWEVSSVVRFEQAIEAPKNRGIKFTREVEI